MEGLAQALPYFVTPEEPGLMARTRLTHLLELIRAEVHRRINARISPIDCVAYYEEQVPFASGSAIADTLNDQTNNPQLRSYLWSYPPGLDWFVRLAEDAPQSAQGVFETSYRTPLSPGRLEDQVADARFGG